MQLSSLRQRKDGANTIDKNENAFTLIDDATRQVKSDQTLSSFPASFNSPSNDSRELRSLDYKVRSISSGDCKKHSEIFYHSAKKTSEFGGSDVFLTEKRNVFYGLFDSQCSTKSSSVKTKFTDKYEKLKHCSTERTTPISTTNFGRKSDLINTNFLFSVSKKFKSSGTCATSPLIHINNNCQRKIDGDERLTDCGSGSFFDRCSLRTQQKDQANFEPDLRNTVLQPPSSRTMPSSQLQHNMEEESFEIAAFREQRKKCVTSKNSCRHEPIKTDSGLILTHRQSEPSNISPSTDIYAMSSSGRHCASNVERLPINYLQNFPKNVEALRETSHELSTRHNKTHNYESHTLNKKIKVPWDVFRQNLESNVETSSTNYAYSENRILRFLRFCNILSILIFMAGFCVIIGSSRAMSRNYEKGKSENLVENKKVGIQRSTLNPSLAKLSLYNNNKSVETTTSMKSKFNDLKVTSEKEYKNEVNTTSSIMKIPYSEERQFHRNLRKLRIEFEEWVSHHSKIYRTLQEKETRFEIWLENHQRMNEKNRKHGPCKMTGKPVFGSNMFKDLTTEEFQKTYLTGYSGPRVNHLSSREEIYGKRSRDSLPSKRGYIHPSMIEKAHTFRVNNKQRIKNRSLFKITWTNIFSKCKGSMSCYLNYLFGSNYNHEPDESNIPNAVDWRNSGCISSIHSQGSCGACWGITAVETIESAYSLKKGELFDLSELEVILCDDTCSMCYGGWPQNAYEYAMENNGLPSESSLSYNGDVLYLITLALAGETDQVDNDYVDEYMTNICPNLGSQLGYDRYAKPSGYGYATERCLCYTNGEGCDCDEQDESRALASIATYGPATMCLDASTWQDYDGGIMTADIGCSQEFMDMNHCVQVVGYAFLDDGEEDEEDDDDNSKSKKSGSKDQVNRDGYFIVRNQWSDYWGMNGYAYLAMGGDNVNTCGCLNDLTQVYFD